MLPCTPRTARTGGGVHSPRGQWSFHRSWRCRRQRCTSHRGGCRYRRHTRCAPDKPGNVCLLPTLDTRGSTRSTACVVGPEDTGPRKLSIAFRRLRHRVRQARRQACCPCSVRCFLRSCTPGKSRGGAHLTPSPPLQSNELIGRGEERPRTRKILGALKLGLGPAARFVGVSSTHARALDLLWMRTSASTGSRGVCRPGFTHAHGRLLQS